MSSGRIWEPKQRFPHFDVAFLIHVSANVKTSLDSWLSLRCNYKNFNELLPYWNTIFEASGIIPEPWSLLFSYKINYLIFFEVRAFIVVVSLVDFFFVLPQQSYTVERNLCIIIKHNTVVPLSIGNATSLSNITGTKDKLTLLRS